MIDVLNWITKHWTELAAALGVGAGSGFLAKKLTDKEQDKKISCLGDRIDVMDKQLTQLENDVKTNTLFDKQFRGQMEREYNAIKENMAEVKGSLEKIIGHLLNSK